MTYLHFVTLNTGAADRIGAIDPAVADPAALDLGRALRNGRAQVSARPGYHLEARRAGAALLCTVWRGDMPLTTFGVAARPRAAANLWRTMHETSADYGLATDPGRPPQTPWCAVRAEPGILLDRDEPWRWLASYEADVAWAWIERRHDGA